MGFMVQTERSEKAQISCLATQRSVCVVVQLSNRRKVRVEVHRNTDGDTTFICVAALI